MLFIDLKKDGEKEIRIISNTNLFPIQNVSIGNYSYGIIDFHAITNNRLYIGNFCSITENVTFLAGLDHPTNLVSTYPFKSYFMMALMRFLKVTL